VTSSGPIKDEKVSRAIEEAKGMNIFILPPEINKSQTWFSIERDPHSLEGKAIRFGLAAIKNVGEAAIEAILNEKKKREFTSLTDFCSKVDNQKVNKKVLESLIQVGAFDAFGKRAALLSGLEKIRQQAYEEQKRKANGQTSFFDNPGDKVTSHMSKDELPEIDEFEKSDLLSLEKSLLGIYLTENPWEKFLVELESQVTHRIYELDQAELGEAKVKIGGVITRIRKILTRRGNNEMAFVTIQDKTGSIELVIFPRIFNLVKDFLNKDRVIIVEGKLDSRDDRVSLIAEKIKEL